LIEKTIDAAIAMAASATQPAIPIHNGCRWRSAYCQTTAARPPPIRPPICPPMEMPEMLRLSRIFSTMRPPMPASQGLMPRARNSMNAAPMTPKIAPRRADGRGIRAQQEGAERSGEETDEIDGEKADSPDRGLEHPADEVEDEHVRADVEEIEVQEPGGPQAVVLVQQADDRSVEEAVVQGP
jgi:hypothetical protein